MKVILYDRAYSEELGKVYAEKIKSFMEKLTDRLSGSQIAKKMQPGGKPFKGKQAGGKTKKPLKEDFRSAVMQMFFSVLSTGLLLSFAKNVFNIDLSVGENQLIYVNTLIKNNLPWLDESVEESGKIDYILDEVMDTVHDAR
jgi:hypothetical protein